MLPSNLQASSIATNLIISAEHIGAFDVQEGKFMPVVACYGIILSVAESFL